jgi:hypothetical protein
MNVETGILQPEEIDLLKSVLDDTAAMVPKEQRTPDFEARLAQRILAGAAGRSHSLTNMQMVALLALADVLKVPTTRR